MVDQTPRHFFDAPHALPIAAVMSQTIRPLIVIVLNWVIVKDAKAEGLIEVKIPIVKICLV